MRSTRGAAGADGPLAPGSADRARAGRAPARRGRRRLTALALAAGALALAVAGAPGTAGTATGSGGGPRTGHAAPGGPVGGPRDAPADPVALAASAAPERCADGSLAAASLRPSGAAGEAVRRIQRSGQLVVGVDQNSFLWGYRDPHTGALEGFDIDLVRAIARDLLGEDPSIVYRTIPTDQRVPALRDRGVDLVVRTMTVNCDRRADVAFSTAYFEAGQQVLAPRASDVTGYDASLAGRTVCTARGSTGQSALEADNPGARVVLVPNQLDCLVRLQLGEVDAVVTDSALAAGQAAQDPTVALVGEPFTTEYYGVAMNLADEDLVRRVNRVLDDFRSGGADSAWRASYERWLDDVMPGRDPSPPTPRYRD
ncbi:MULTISPECIES: glutamate ABC transporter substrate-binding protein [Streptomyces]|uniref:glutamate ABC transporter substrate-binding protein n=1 Tax=Streptomyces TaxID=1883 RepID=UPI0022499ACB|nr:glutamate ABC transporter substrate-binding protein [Streptomyces sp. JHD 1]MCX2969945.1 glutamate ABC transporter substrate-binding protein [Streptomyces sp. JHD 1]